MNAESKERSSWKSRTFSSSTSSATRNFRLTNNTPRVDELNEIVRASEQFQKAEAANRYAEDPDRRWHGAGVL